MHSAPSPRLPWRPLVLTTCTGLLLLALFTVPYHIPVRPSFSDSYVFGYSNRAGVVIVLLLALVYALFGRELRPAPRAAGKPLSPGTLRKALALTLLFGGVLFLLTYRLDGFVESVYTVDRTRLLLEGHTPYRDFEFCYGVLALYGPAFLVRTLHLTVPAACDLFWLAASLLGVGELYLILRWAEFPADRQREVFLVGLVLFLPALFTTTTAYTYPRFLTGGLLAMVSQRLLCGSPRGRLMAFLLPVPGAALVLAISPEMGLAYASGMALYLLCCGELVRLPNRLAYLAMLLGVALTIRYAASHGAFTTLASFSGGAFSFPIVPAAHIVLFLLALAIYAVYVGSRLRRGQSSPLVALGCVAPAMLPAALGRCDPGHITFDGIPIFLIALLVCSTASRAWRLLLPATLCVLVIVPFARGYRSFVSILAQTTLPYFLHSHSPQPASPHDATVQHVAVLIWGQAKGSAYLQRMRTRQTQERAIDLPAVFGMPSGTVFAAPFAFMGDHTGPYHTRSIDEGYFLSVVDMVTPEDVLRKMAELDDHPERPLLVPADAEYSCLLHPENVRAEIQSLFGYPYHAEVKHPGVVTEPLCALIRNRYHIAQPVSPEHFNDALWLRNPVVSADASRTP